MHLGLWKKPAIPPPMPATAPDDPGPFYGKKQTELTMQIESEKVNRPDLKLPPR
jgi:hypothetical protein